MHDRRGRRELRPGGRRRRPAGRHVSLPIAVEVVTAAEAAAAAMDHRVRGHVESLLADRAREAAIRHADEGRFAAAMDTLGGASMRLASTPVTTGTEGLLRRKRRELGEEWGAFTSSSYDAAVRKASSYRSQASRRSRGRNEEGER